MCPRGGRSCVSLSLQHSLGRGPEGAQEAAWAFPREPRAWGAGDRKHPHRTGWDSGQGHMASEHWECQSGGWPWPALPPPPTALSCHAFSPLWQPHEANCSILSLAGG